MYVKASTQRKSLMEVQNRRRGFSTDYQKTKFSKVHEKWCGDFYCDSEFFHALTIAVLITSTCISSCAWR